MSLNKKTVYFLLIITIILSFNVSAATAAGPTPFYNCRLGVGGAYASAAGYDFAQLNIGRYVDWRTSSNPYDPNGTGLNANVQYLQMIRVKQKKNSGTHGPRGDYVDPPAYNVSPSLNQIAAVAKAQPGAVWLVGNEIERVDWYRDWLSSWAGQDEITPELYATAFHEIQAVIKAADPTAKVAIGGVILGTPLRLKYLDRIWDSYFDQFGYSMGKDIDVWNVHGFILPEVRGAWGMDIPAGLETPEDYMPEEGLFYSKGYSGDPSEPDNNVDYFTARDKQYDIDLFAKYIKEFRAWMAAKGERNKPLLNTEYGPLNDFDGYYNKQDAVDFIYETFDYMFSATDADTGYPLDENRLVQGWFWYSLNAEWFPLGQLYNPDNKKLTTVGQGWKNYVSDSSRPLASQSQVNLLAANLSATPNPAKAPSGQKATVTLAVDVANNGNTKTSTNNAVSVEFWNGPPNAAGSTQIGSTQVIDDIGGCGQFSTVSLKWSNLSPGQYNWYVKVVPLNSETKQSDNTAGSILAVLADTPEADLSVNKTVDDSTPEVGDEINYLITVTNNGPDATSNVVVEDKLPAGLLYKSYSATKGTYVSASGDWNVGTLLNGATAELTITAQIEDGYGTKAITNSASASADETDNNASNNTSETILVVTEDDLEADLSVNKTVDDTTPEVGDEINYLITVTNNGPDPTGNVVVKDKLPADLLYKSYSATKGTYASVSGNWNVGTLLNGASESLTITAQIKLDQEAAATITNSASVSADGVDNVPGNNTAQVDVKPVGGSAPDPIIQWLPIITK